MTGNDRVSTKQLEANRRNAKKGGVKTVPGKMVARMNACKHGGLSNRILEGELPAYKIICDELSEEYEPAGFVQKVLVERIALCVLQMRRMSFAVNEFLLQIDDPEVSKPVFEFPGEREIVAPGYQPAITIGQIERVMDLYERYQVSLENRFLKLNKELSATCANRQ